MRIFICFFTIAISALCILIEGWKLKRLQTLLLEINQCSHIKRASLTKIKKVFVLFTTTFPCLTDFVRQFVTKIIALRTINNQSSMSISHIRFEDRLSTRETEPNSKNWDMKAYADAISSKSRTWVSLKEMLLEFELVKLSRTMRSDERLGVNSYWKQYHCWFEPSTLEKGKRNKQGAKKSGYQTNLADSVASAMGRFVSVNIYITVK